MTEEAQSHQTNTEMIQSAPPEVDAGTDIALKVKVSCPSACDLRGQTVRIMAQDGSVAKEVALTSFEEGSNQTDEFAVKAPIELGACTWSVVFPVQEIGEVLHEESSTPVMFTVKPHKASIAVWDFPSPVIMNSPFRIKVGVRCSAECQLRGKDIEVYDEKGAKAATGRLGETPWPETSGLYWAEVGLGAPATEGVYSWTVKFPASGLELPHEEASSSFSLRAARPPEQVVTVEVIGVVTIDTKTPLKNARVVLHPYSGYTDEHGIAKIEVTKGKHELCVVAQGYLPFETTIEVAGDVTVKAELYPPAQAW